ncbi:HNH endonuclease [Nocardioides szechwanensis]|uniref:HNH endonuclease n=1 Tax=Nocardioides szechwanensis TaxID=1005944 RepID=A0A1H0ICK9_9ACTN|nr:HNH endonuclease signature motif containing protein [Nocardioides szechwanensis]GEP34460.1 HNH endonuclease [Nocardioides szechwanensis]SDO28811.1 HNH endonuclease [Nocardioides szechwanensis]
MTSTGHRTDRDHPILAALSAIEVELDAIEHAPAWFLSDADARQALLRTTRVAVRVAAAELKLAAHADRNDLGAESGATSAAVWWAIETRMTQREAARKMKLAKALEQQDQVSEALAAGDVLVDQAQAVTESVDRLPDTVLPEVRTQARDYLLEAAKHYDSKALRLQGRRILDVVAPEVGEAEEAKQLEAEERKAEQAARLTMHDDGHGQTHGRFTLGTAEADMLRKALHAIANAKGHGLDPHGMGVAFGEYVRGYPADKLPTAGGVNATVVVTMTLETLLGGLKAAQLDTGTMISPGLARKLACGAGVIPVVLGGKSEVLDVGRKRRFHTKAQRIAMAVRDKGCVAMGCERPGSWCHAHHLIPWSQGGSTSVENGALLCPRHHALAHHHDYAVTHHPEGRISFTRRE